MYVSAVVKGLTVARRMPNTNLCISLSPSVWVISKVFNKRSWTVVRTSSLYNSSFMTASVSQILLYIYIYNANKSLSDELYFRGTQLTVYHSADG